VTIKSAIFRVVTLCNSKSTNVLEEHISSIFRVKEKAKKETASLANKL
jgi:hypothetical protein